MRRNRTGFGERVLSFHGVALPQFRCGGPAVVRRRPVPRMQHVTFMVVVREGKACH